MAPSLFRAAATFFSWPRRGFPLPAIKKGRQPFVIVTLDPLSEHFRGRNALGFARRRTSEFIAKPLGLLHEALLSGRSFLRTETRSYSLPLQRIACSLLADFCSSLPTSSVALRVELRWCGS